jgi:steroid delta-isomerase-like uncharacterized protein
MPDANSHLLKRWFEEVWNQGREATIDELAAPDIVAHDLVDIRGDQVAGVDKFKAFWRQFREAFPDIHITVEDALTDGDKLVVRCTVRGTHSSDCLGVKCNFEPVKFSGIVIARVRNGQMTEVWENWNFLKLYQQMGAVPASLV